MKYIVYNRFKAKAICGDVNLPSLTECECKDGMITWHGKDLCVATSENAHQYFALNDDGNGMERGSLTHRIIQKLSKRDVNYQVRWDKVWEDKLCQQYKRTNFSDYWLWNHAFYNASIQDLRYIANLVGA